MTDDLWQEAKLRYREKLSQQAKAYEDAKAAYVVMMRRAYGREAGR